MIKVFKVCDKDEWEEAKDQDFFKGSKRDQRDGFIHLSTSEQLKGTLEKYFKLKSNLYLLELNVDNLEIIWEESRNKKLFPHLYEPLPLSSVMNVYRIFLDIGGNHIIPEKVSNDV